MPKAISMIPELRNATILECQTGLRVSTPSHQPRMLQLTEDRWALVGFGSKGLLYHVLFGKEIAAAMIK